MTCPHCGHGHIRYVQQTLPLIMGAWQVKNMNVCPTRRGGCGKPILVAVKPVRAYLEQKAAQGSPDVDPGKFVEQVSELYLDEGGLARFNVEGTVIAVQSDVIVEAYGKPLDEWFKRDKWTWKP